MKVYGKHALSETTCKDWFQRLKNGDSDLNNKYRGKPPTRFEDAELQALLDKGSTQTLKKLAKALEVDQGTISRRLHAIEKIRNKGKWVPYELKKRDIERLKNSCEILFDRFKRKSFLHRIVTGDEKWIYFDNLKRKKAWVDPGQPSISQPVRNIHGKKVLLCI